MTIEERLQQLIGSQVIAIVNLQAQLEAADKKIKDMEKNGKDNGNG